jgi:undecaprenyl-diphosphatase
LSAPNWPCKAGLGRFDLTGVADEPARVFRIRGPVWLKIGAAIALSAAVAFLVLAEWILKDEAQRLDVAALRWLATHRTPALTQFFLAITALGSWLFVTMLTLILCVAGLFVGARRAAATLLIAVLGIPPLVVLLKPLYGRPRPDAVAHLDFVDSASFPSGHALAAAIFFGSSALIAVQRTTSDLRRVLITACAGLLIVLVGLSRVYLGVHYSSDVLGGVLVGTSWSLFVLLAAHSWAARARR